VSADTHPAGNTPQPFGAGNRGQSQPKDTRSSLHVPPAVVPVPAGKMRRAADTGVSLLSSLCRDPVERRNGGFLHAQTLPRGLIAPGMCACASGMRMEGIVQHSADRLRPDEPAATHHRDPDRHACIAG